MHRRHRLGHRPLLRRLRPAREPRDVADVRGHARPPHNGRWWELVEKYRVSILYTAPTAIRTFMKWGDDIPAGFDMSLAARCSGRSASRSTPRRGCGTADVIGGDRCPIVDTWWQTETGAIMISPLPGVTATKPGSAMGPLPGIGAEVVDDEAHPVGNGGGGYLVLTEPWPSMLRGIWGDNERYVDTYWSRWPGLYFAGDGAKLDEDGAIWLLGRVDDVMNVSGHRISTTEVESALVSHPKVAEAAVVGATDETTGQGIVAFVILREGVEAGDGTPSSPSCATTSPTRSARSPSRARSWSSPELPKTRSGKIMRRLLRDVAEHRDARRHHDARRPAVMNLIAPGSPRRRPRTDACRCDPSTTGPPVAR